MYSILVCARIQIQLFFSKFYLLDAVAIDGLLMLNYVFNVSQFFQRSRYDRVKTKWSGNIFKVWLGSSCHHGRRDGVDFVVLANLSMRVEFVMPQLGVTMETIIFDYWELFSKFYRNLELNRNKNNRKYGNEICRKNRKRERFGHLSAVSRNYRIYSVFYRR